VQASEAIQLLGLEEMALAVSNMSPLSLLVFPPVKPAACHHLPSQFRVSAATFFENKHGEF